MTPGKTILAMVSLHESTILSFTKDSSTKFALLALPPELHVHLFKQLDIVTATCLSLTNKHFYATFKAVYGEKPIRFYSLEDTEDNTVFIFTALPRLLKEWMKPMVWGGKAHIYRFVTPERLHELKTADKEVIQESRIVCRYPLGYPPRRRWRFRLWK
ncbi:hypothetical protein N431DRAFT_393852 [Stipitochalara longipes BDJ]|nr:hypothetical protein N431DRAFT_393852 [Stipitochalara longipes BDJ]